MRYGRMTALFFLVACGSASWDATFDGTDTRSTSITPVDASAGGSDGGSTSSCDGVAKSSPTVPITVTFPNHGTGAETIHVVASTGSCDVVVDTDTDGVVFSSDAIPCADLLAPGTPESGTAQASGPNDLLFQWSYGAACTIDDDYHLSTK